MNSCSRYSNSKIKYCVDESSRNNQFKCFECNKLIVYFQLNNKTFHNENIYKCVNNSELFQNILESSYLSRSSYEASNTSNRFENTMIFSGLLPESFNAEDIKVPLSLLDCQNNRLISSLLTITITLLVFIVCLAVLIMSTFYLHIQNNFCKKGFFLIFSTIFKLNETYY